MTSFTFYISVFGFGVIVVIFGMFYKIYYVKQVKINSLKELKYWAESNEYTIISFETCDKILFTKFPHRSRTQIVYVVEIENASKNRKKAWVLVGGFYDPFKRKFEVKWES